ncbi:acyl-CoA reductase [Amycolatopsis sp. SID8362]|uniref:acyl-CoA reductase n=1 Tax=Amycolatopsis sp. SID8362 TaxID=2690346 RepID=UPI0013687C66|nr:acyl-CoA reductase [Amycolatopsis sp. SID8362]NBH06072.1 hypothetical protein [Amycolatopsis sp. SID8362]NED42771.1 hypothetical protein [Amycolatopsis sp. SID8362]
MSNDHYWQGRWVCDEKAADLLESLEESAQHVLCGDRLTPLTVMRAAETLAAKLSRSDDHLRVSLAGMLADHGLPSDEIDSTFAALATALSRNELERKVNRELGGLESARLTRFDFRVPVFEAWVPVGLLTHIAASNAPTVGVLSAVEGLLTGNLNVIKISGTDSSFTAELLAALAEQDPTGLIAGRLIVLRFPSTRKDWLERVIKPADAVAVWGGEEALAGIAELVRPGTRMIDWGPKLSFAYLTRDTWSANDVLHGIAADICRLDQQACSSPQVIYLDAEDDFEVVAFAQRFARVLAAVVQGGQPRTPDDQEWAEINNTTVVAELEQHLGLTKVLTAGDGSWRVLADRRPALRASPLYRSVWVKPLPRTKIAATLRPMRRYLQTVGLAASRHDTAVLARAFLSTGVQRVSTPGKMLAGYAGEPHDGVYALQRYSRRVDVQLDDRFDTDTALDDLVEAGELPVPAVRVTPKSKFWTLQSGDGEVFFLSGGSSGAPQLSSFTWADYAEHMRIGAEAMLAGGLDPRTDRVMNLFFGGRMYAGFISFFSSLERMGAVQFPMSADPARLEEIAASIVDNNVDTLVTLPSFAVLLFTEQAELLRRYRGVRKIFYAGELFSEHQIAWLREQFGIETIHSAAYGTVDAGPLGFQCQDSPAGVHHLFSNLYTVEVLDQQLDKPAPAGSIGRLVITAHTRRGQRIERYEIGDLGRLVGEPCPCGRRTPRVELAGRMGDVFRIGFQTLNYRKLQRIAEEAFGYSGAFQIVLDNGDRMTLRMASGEPDEIVREFIARSGQLAEAVIVGGLHLAAEITEPSTFSRTPTSGKVIAVVDNRFRSAK